MRLPREAWANLNANAAVQVVGTWEDPLTGSRYILVVSTDCPQWTWRWPASELTGPARELAEALLAEQ